MRCMNDPARPDMGERSSEIVQTISAADRNARPSADPFIPDGEACMEVVRIERFDDPRLEDYRNMSDAELLRQRSLFVAEGRLVVGRLLQEEAGSVVTLLLNNAAYKALEAHAARLAPDTPVYVCETGHFAGITGFDLHRGCLAIARRPAERDAWDVVARSDLILVLEGVADPDNVGSVFRNAHAFGAGAV